MARRFTRLTFLPLGIFAVLGLSFLPFLAMAQFDETPDPFDSFLKSVLNFDEPTGIRGTLRYIERDEQIVWLNWEERSDDRPLFQSGWHMVPGDATLAVHPANAEQFAELQQLANGTALEMIIQANEFGHRRILSYQDRSAPKIPL